MGAGIFLTFADLSLFLRSLRFFLHFPCVFTSKKLSLCGSALLRPFVDLSLFLRSFALFPFLFPVFLQGNNGKDAQRKA